MKGDIKQINAIANKYKIIGEERREFGDFIEKEKKREGEGLKMTEVILLGRS